jgi:hypothetical protein
MLYNEGFGRKISWQEDAIIPPGHQLTFKDALRTVSTHIVLKLVIPNWAFGLTQRFREIRLAFDELEVFKLNPVSYTKYH